MRSVLVGEDVIDVDLSDGGLAMIRELQNDLYPDG